MVLVVLLHKVAAAEAQVVLPVVQVVPLLVRGEIMAVAAEAQTVLLLLVLVALYESFGQCCPV
jgi:hypothetical protein